MPSSPASWVKEAPPWFGAVGILSDEIDLRKLFGGSREFRCIAGKRLRTDRLALYVSQGHDDFVGASRPQAALPRECYPDFRIPLTEQSKLCMTP